MLYPCLTCFFVGFCLAWFCCWWEVCRVRRAAKIVHLSNLSLAEKLEAARQGSKS